MMKAPPTAVLFDLDGTLADTAPDLLAALESLRRQLRLPAMDLDPLRQFVSRGAPAILEAGLCDLAASERILHRTRYLEAYRSACWIRSRPFGGIPELLRQLESHGIPWGVVTNKLRWLAEPLMKQAGWAERAGCLVAGDCAARPKPAPDPVLLACQRLRVDPSGVIFVGDDERDVVAGRAAGARTVAAAWGYIPEPASVPDWGADAIADVPGDLASLFGLAEREAS